MWFTLRSRSPEDVRNDVFREPYPERDVGSPPPPELYNIAEDPLERENLVDKYPSRARKMLQELETWFEEVEAERATIDDE